MSDPTRKTPDPTQLETPSGRPLRVIDLGRMEYHKAWDLQREAQQARVRVKIAKARGEHGVEAATSPIPVPPDQEDLLFLVEHPHVYTVGKSGDLANMLLPPERLQEIGAELVRNDRGGDITYHGPGQIVGYPILDLDHHGTDIHRYLRQLEEVVIRVCADYGLKAGRVEGLTGVWIEDRKICAMGVKCSRWITMHGFALNVTTDLRYFDYIVPCGIRDRSVTSLEQELGVPMNPEDVKPTLIRHVLDVFGMRPAEVAGSRMTIAGNGRHHQDLKHLS